MFRTEKWKHLRSVSVFENASFKTCSGAIAGLIVYVHETVPAKTVSEAAAASGLLEHCLVSFSVAGNSFESASKQLI